MSTPHLSSNRPKTPLEPDRRTVRFPTFPVTSSSRPLNVTEEYAVLSFTDHAHRCNICKLPYDWLCLTGHRLAEDVAHYMYERSDCKIYSTARKYRAAVRLEVPIWLTTVRSLLHEIRKGGECERDKKRTQYGARQKRNSPDPIDRSESREQKKRLHRVRTLILLYLICM